ncbi:hypothetical protein SDC9_66629 [bioreactor metagenome]|uniref:Uncharacterized protein n=1 Tax=bioreactor metagenome TaxID=1076179 RepID=A0A644XVG3_9ZZZZ
MKNFLLGVFLTGMVIFSQNTVSAAEQAESTTQAPQKSSTAKVEIVPSEASYTLAIIPVLDMSGMEEKERTVAKHAIQNALEQKYPKKKTKVNLLSEKAIVDSVHRHPFENYDAPVLAELVAIGEDLKADRVIYISLEPTKSEEDGFRIIVGTQTYASEVSMKMKCVDVKNKSYLFNQLVVKEGSSSAVSFWKFGGASKSRSVKKAVTACMEEFLTNFE